MGIGVQGYRGTGSPSPLDASRNAYIVARNGVNGSLNGVNGSRNGVNLPEHDCGRQLGISVHRQKH
eukprot:1673551-Heterocapsa_arctica.AAC.1